MSSEQEQQLIEFRLIFQTHPDALIFTDLSRNIRYANPACEHIFGYEPAEMIGQPIRIIYAHEEDYTQQGKLRYNPQGEGYAAPYPVDYKRKNGEVFPAETVGAKVHTPQGEHLGYLGIIKDVTEQRAIETALQNSLYLMDRMMTTSPAINWILDVQQDRIIYISPNVSEVVGFSPNEIQNANAATRSTFFHTDDQSSIRAHFRQLPKLEDGEVAQIEVRLRLMDDTWYWFRMRQTVFARNEQGKPYQFIGTLENIHAWKLAQEERERALADLRVSQNRLDSILNSLHDIVWSLDMQTLRLLYANPAIETIYGYPAQAFMEDADLWWSCIHPDDLSLVRDAAEQITDPDYRERIYRILRPDGGVRWLHERFQVIYDENQQPVRVDGITYDITARQATEEKLQQANAMLAASREALRRLIEQLPIGIQVFDPDGTCIDANQTLLEIFGLQSVRQIVLAYNIFQDPLAVYQGTADAARRALQGETVSLGDLTFEFDRADPRFARTSGKRIINVTIFPVFDPNDTVVSFVGLNDDVTEQREAEQRQMELAIQTERVNLLEELISDVSHDLKTPLSIIATSSYLLRKNLPDEQLDRYIERIDYQRERLEKLIDALLTMSRLNQVTDLDFAPTHIGTMLRDIHQQKQLRLSEKNLSLELTIQEGLPVIAASESELYRVFENLIENAIHYTPQGGSLVVVAQKQANGVAVSIRDTGIGIDEKDLPHIFDRFYRADKARSAETGGTGLGLAIVKKIVELHDGTVQVQSQPNAGSTFTIYLPA